MKNSRLSVKRKDSIITVLLLLTITLGIIAKLTPYGQTYGEGGTEVVVINPSTGDGNFTYSPANGTLGTRFNATFWVYNVTGLFGFQVNLIINDTFLNITRAWTPVTDTSYVFYGQAQMPLGPTFYDIDGNGVNERVLVGATELFGATAFTGDGLLAIIELEIIYTPPAGTISSPLNINNTDTKLLDDTLSEIITIKTDGNYQYTAGPQPPTAEFTYSPLSPVAGKPVTFDASNSTPNGGTIINYTWNFGDGTPEVTETDPITTHTFTSAGTFNVTLTVFDSEGLSNTTWQTITVLAAPPMPIIRVEPSTHIITRRAFNISIVVANLTAALRIIGAQFRLLYNSTYLQVLDVAEGPFFPSFPQRPTPPYTIFTWYDEPDDPVYGSHISVLDMLFPNDTGVWPGPFPEGEGTIATITFNVTKTFEGPLPLSFYVANNQTVFSDDTPDYVPVQAINGTLYIYYNVDITQQPKPTYIHGEKASMKFTIRYWDGSYYTANNFSSIRVKIVFNSTDFVGETMLTPTDFNPATNEWTAEVLIQWNFSLGTYQLVISAYDIIDTAGISGPIIDVWSSPFNITKIPTIDYETLNVELDVGSIYFAGETAEFYVLTALKGTLVNVETITATLYYASGTQQLDLTANIENIAIGIYRIPYTLPITTEAGTYTLVVEANYTTPYINAYGAGLASFQVSTTLDGWGALISDINDTIATIIIPNLTEIKANLTTINATITGLITDSKNEILANITTSLGTILAKIDDLNMTLTSINGTVATINSILGTVQLDVKDIEATVLSINGTVATINTTIGEIQVSLEDIDGKITEINGDVATIKTTVGEIQVSLDDIQTSADGAKSAAEGAASTAATTLYVASVLSAIAAIVGILILLMLKRK
jgi:hypothetical protein